MLSDEKRRALYDAGIYDPLDDDQEDVEVSKIQPIAMAHSSPRMARFFTSPCCCNS